MNENDGFNIGANITQDEPAVYNSYYNHKPRKEPWVAVIWIIIIMIIAFLVAWYLGVFKPIDREAEYNKLLARICDASVEYANKNHANYKSISGKIIYIEVGSLVEDNRIEANMTNYINNETISDSTNVRLEVLPSGSFQCEGLYDPTKDTEKPVITLKGEATIYGKVAQKVTDPGATASDDKDGDISEKIKRNGNVNVNEIGIYKVNYVVSDKAGNLSDIVQRTYIIQ